MTTATEECGFPTALKVIGGKWKADILWELHVAPRRFGRLRQLIPGISEKMLMQQLRDMEADGIISRTVHPGTPPKVVYALTEHGAALNAGVTLLSEWGKRHRARVLAQGAGAPSSAPAEDAPAAAHGAESRSA